MQTQAEKNEVRRRRYRRDPEYQKGLSQQRREHLRSVVNSAKSKPCADCNQTFPAVCMDFDHLGNKEDCIGTMVSHGRPLLVILEEINKCEVVCSNCHRLRTARRQGKVL